MLDGVTPFWFFLTLGFILLATELLVFQFSTFWLFFLGLGALLAALFAWGAGGATLLATTAVFVVASAIVTALMYLPIRRWQQNPANGGDNNAIGKKAVVTSNITVENGGKVTWSGSEWQAELASGSTADIAAGDSVRIVAVEGIRLIVEAV